MSCAIFVIVGFYDGHVCHVNTFAASPASRAAGVMMLRSPTRIL